MLSINSSSSINLCDRSFSPPPPYDPKWSLELENDNDNDIVQDNDNDIVQDNDNDIVQDNDNDNSIYLAKNDVPLIHKCPWCGSYYQRQKERSISSNKMEGGFHFIAYILMVAFL